MNSIQRLLYALLLIAWMAFLPSTSVAQSKSTAKTKADTTSKKVGFAGDPARKRGLEIGFDLGKKAGKSDKEQDLKPDLKRHEDYQKPEKYFRHEYGSSAAFASGFRSGFSGGYQAAFGKKVNLSSDGTPLKSTPKTGAPPKKGGGNSSDAL